MNKETGQSHSLAAPLFNPMQRKSIKSICMYRSFHRERGGTNHCDSILFVLVTAQDEFNSRENGIEPNMKDVTG